MPKSRKMTRLIARSSLGVSSRPKPEGTYPTAGDRAHHRNVLHQGA